MEQRKSLATRLWERGQLAAALADIGTRLRARDLVTDHAELSQTAQAFLRASIRRDRLRRQRAITVLSVLLALALAASILAIIQRRAAEQQRDVAVSRQAAGQALELRDTNPALAAQLSLAAYQQIPTTEARGSLLSIAADPYATRLTGHTTGLTKVAFSPDGHTLATASVDNTVLLWDISDSYHPTGWVRSPATTALSGRWPSVRMGAPWPPAASTPRCGCGISAICASPTR